MKPGIVAIVGPTAAGKSALALEMAELFGAEIVNADSRQIYRYMDIGTAKPSLADRTRVPHHLLDVADPDEPFDVARFRKLALSAIGEITRRGRRVFVCGGTGLYVRALLRGLFEGPAADPDLRRRLRRQEEEQGRGTLWRILAERDPLVAARVHPNDLCRIVRALEVLELTGRPMGEWQRAHGFAQTPFDCLMIGLTRPRPLLYALIEERCRAMLEAGLAEEIAELYRRGYGPELAPLQSLGYREIGLFVRGKAKLESAFESFVRQTRRFAKRQITWFKREPSIVWHDPDRDRSAIRQAMERFLESRCSAPI